ncbi:hypothetical protein AB9K34_17630 [Sedimentitalea sp. XS_ASV28]|uniref:hypothetical protein n=1 Tax=Sedimentitalea sp. XS_ASV28 TaxID=3241296 RepID=UPI00351975D8
MDFVALLTAFGVGSLATAVIQFWLSERIISKRRIYDERKEAYLGLLESWMKYESREPNKQGEFNVGHWLLRSQLVASDSTRLLLDEWEQTEAGSPDRIRATKQLKAAMRTDLRSP